MDLTATRRIRIDTTDTFMMWAGDYHVQVGDRQWQCYFKVPETWIGCADLRQRCLQIAQDIYAGWNRQIREQDESENGYYLLKDLACVVPTPEEEAGKPWEKAACYLIGPGLTASELPPRDF